MFDDWKEPMNRYVQKHIDRRCFLPIADELDADIAELCDVYPSILLENGVIDASGNDTDLDFDEDDLLDAMLDRFLQDHDADDARAALYAVLIDAFLTLVDEASEDL